MTTNVYDRLDLKLATDSRWSVSTPCKSYVLYTDEAQFDKLCVCPKLNLAFAFAGGANWISQWKWWLTNGIYANAPVPVVIKNAEFAYCAAHLDTGALAKMLYPDYAPPKMLMAQDQSGDIVQALFAGSGSDPAMNCWLKNKDAIVAIKSAANDDPFTGGSVVSSCLRSGSHNATVGTADDLKDALLKGHVMRKAQERYIDPMPVAEAAANIPEVAQLMKKIANGTAIACAPFPGMGEHQYTDDQILSHNEFIEGLRAIADRD